MMSEEEENADEFYKSLQLTPVSDSTVKSAFSEMEEKTESRLLNSSIPSKKATKRGRPHSKKEEKLAVLEALFNEPIMEGRRHPLRKTNSAPSSQRLEPLDGTFTRRESSSSMTFNKSTFQVISFHRACRYGQLEIMETMLRKDQIPSIDCRDGNLNTGLHEAVFHGQVEAVKLLLKRGADFQAKNMLRERPRDLARLTEIVNLLDYWAELEEQVQLDPFLAACWKGESSKVENLFNDDVNQRDSHGNTGLHFVAARNLPEISRVLLKKGFAVDAQNDQGNTPLHIAAWFSAPEVVWELLKANCDYHLFNRGDKRATDLGNKSILKVFRRFARENDLIDPILLGAYLDKRKANQAEEELEDSEEEEEEGLSNRICGLDREERKLRQIMAILSKSSSSVTKTGVTRRKQGRPKKQILQAEINIFPTSNSKGASSASSGVPSDIFRDKDVYSTDASGLDSDIEPVVGEDEENKDNLESKSILEKLIRAKDHSQIRKLLAKTPNAVLIKDSMGRTALHEAAQAGDLRIALRLVKAGAKINVVARDGETPLHKAARQGHIEIVKFLLERRANKYVKNRRGKRPLDVCKDEVTRQAMVEFNGKPRVETRIIKRGRPIKRPTTETRQNMTKRTKTYSRNLGGSPKRKEGEEDKSVGLTKLPNSGLVEIESTEPLLQINIPDHSPSSSANDKWYLIAAQLTSLLNEAFPDQHELITSHTLFSATKELLEGERDKLLDSAILEKFPSIRIKLVDRPLVLWDKEAIFEQVEQRGFTLSNLPMIYIDLDKLITTSTGASLGRRPNESKEEDILPPKLKMKFNQRRSADPMALL